MGDKSVAATAAILSLGRLTMFVCCPIPLQRFLTGICDGLWTGGAES